MPLLSFRPRSSGLQVIAQMCPRWHRQGARRAPGAGRHIGRPDDKINAIREALAAGNGIRKVAKLVGDGNETVHRIAREMRDAA